ncbi:uncharacterized protein LOC129594830 isoform X2 [Paramacrobiotus metropolitanus]|uniref:uncharacterized protein LOC129594830 isoform X2 n=1 Tax=Paramacrobiotus metropolitanus TaxID=2943436 RepID=UPI00244601F9|nr:uncharacterized protein LOC129594830 isoform X2 [Paramacrobiotus metropolitanus]
MAGWYTHMKHLYVILIIGGIFAAHAVSTVVTSYSDERERIVEFAEDEDVELQCSTNTEPYMNIVSARFMESYQYNVKSGRCQISPTFCQGTTVPIMESQLGSCFNTPSCQLRYTRADRQRASNCGLSMPMRLVVSFSCHHKPVPKPPPQKQVNSMYNSATCGLSFFRKLCG